MRNTEPVLDVSSDGELSDEAIDALAELLVGAVEAENGNSDMTTTTTGAATRPPHDSETTSREVIRDAFNNPAKTQLGGLQE